MNKSAVFTWLSFYQIYKNNFNNNENENEPFAVIFIKKKKKNEETIVFWETSSQDPISRSKRSKKSSSIKYTCAWRQSATFEITP